MEENEYSPVRAFDEHYTTNKIRMLKVLLSRIPAAHQIPFASCIKLLELQYTLSLRQPPAAASPAGHRTLQADFFSGDNTETIRLLEELLPYSSPAERTKIENIKSLLLNLGKMREMMEMLDMLKELFPDGFGGDSGAPTDILSGLAGSGSPDISWIMDMLDSLRKEP